MVDLGEGEVFLLYPPFRYTRDYFRLGGYAVRRPIERSGNDPLRERPPGGRRGCPGQLGRDPDFGHDPGKPALAAGTESPAPRAAAGPHRWGVLPPADGNHVLGLGKLV